MQRRQWFLLYLTLGTGCLVFFLAAMAYFWQIPRFFAGSSPQEKQYTIPKTAFSHSTEEYARINEDTLSLSYATPTLQLPDLRQMVTYFGKNGRPDASGNHTLLHMALAGSNEIFSATPSQPLYLQYDKNLSPPRYVPSVGNGETSLWLLIEPEGNQALVHVQMRNEKGEIVQHPSSFSQFVVPEREFARQPGKQQWELGKWRVDGSLLARQRARWFGADRFLERHGGEEYSYALDKQRIDFGEKEEIYSVYIGVGDILVWEKDRWVSVEPGSDSLGKPLLIVKKIDERLMTFELWDVDGKGKILLNLIKSAEPMLFQNLLRDFKYVGARTRSQFVFAIRDERVVLSPEDWLLLTDEGWKKLTTIEEIDAYVQRELAGPLFIFDGVIKQDDHQVLLGSVYNKTRTEVQEIEVAMQQGAEPVVQRPASGHSPSLEEKEDEDEEEEIPLRRPPMPATNSVEARKR